MKNPNLKFKNQNLIKINQRNSQFWNKINRVKVVFSVFCFYTKWYDILFEIRAISIYKRFRREEYIEIQHVYSFRASQTISDVDVAG